METDRAAEKPQTVFPQPCEKPFGFRTVPTGPAINRQPKPDRSLATKPGHFNLLLTGFIYLVAIMDWFSRYVLAWDRFDNVKRTHPDRVKGTHPRVNGL